MLHSNGESPLGKLFEKVALLLCMSYVLRLHSRFTATPADASSVLLSQPLAEVAFEPPSKLRIL